MLERTIIILIARGICYKMRLITSGIDLERSRKYWNLIKSEIMRVSSSTHSFLQEIIWWRRNSEVPGDRGSCCRCSGRGWATERYRNRLLPKLHESHNSYSLRLCSPAHREECWLMCITWSLLRRRVKRTFPASSPPHSTLYSHKNQQTHSHSTVGYCRRYSTSRLFTLHLFSQVSSLVGHVTDEFSRLRLIPQFILTKMGWYTRFQRNFSINDF